VTYNTDIPSGSGTIAPNANVVLPKGTTKVYWTTQAHAVPSNFDGATFDPEDNCTYTITVEKKPI
jgi:uncharacterized protein (DUF2147 family)